MKKTLCFIVNPKSGGKNKNHIPQLIKSNIDANRFDIDIHVTSSESDTIQKAARAIENKFDAIVAVGGDGTLNNIAQYVKGSDTKLGIVPMGSGNGFARELGISMDTSKSIRAINLWQTKKIDTGTINDKFFLNLAGVGFDAHVSGLFASSTTRGFKNYVKITLKEFMNYKSQSYKIMMDDKEIHHKAFLLCVCNGTQFGNNAFIAPHSKLDNGYFNMTIVEDFKLWHTPQIGLRLFNKTIDKLSFIKTYTAKEIKIIRDSKAIVNIDGEPVMMDKDLHLKIYPKSINILVP